MTLTITFKITLFERAGHLLYKVEVVKINLEKKNNEKVTEAVSTI